MRAESLEITESLVLGFGCTNALVFRYWNRRHTHTDCIILISAGYWFNVQMFNNHNLWIIIITQSLNEKNATRLNSTEMFVALDLILFPDISLFTLPLMTGSHLSLLSLLTWAARLIDIQKRRKQSMSLYGEENLLWDRDISHMLKGQWLGNGGISSIFNLQYFPKGHLLLSKGLRSPPPDECVWHDWMRFSGFLGHVTFGLRNLLQTIMFP